MSIVSGDSQLLHCIKRYLLVCLFLYLLTKYPKTGTTIANIISVGKKRIAISIIIQNSIANTESQSNIVGIHITFLKKTFSETIPHLHYIEL